MVSADSARGWADFGREQIPVRGFAVASRQRGADYARRGVLVCGVARMVIKAALIATAYHEAGHAMMCWSLGVRSKRVSIVQGEDSMGSFLHERVVRGHPETDNSNRMRLSLERYAAIALAGPIAQQLYNSRSFRTYHASKDYKIAATCAFRVNGSEESAKAWLKWIQIRTKDQLRVFWPIVDRLAKRLLDAKTLHDVKISEIISLNPPPN